MLQYVHSRVSGRDQRALNTVRALVGKIENHDLKLSCHDVIARIHPDAAEFGLQAVRGYFWPNFEHSWLVTPEGNVIDAYPVGILTRPFLVDRHVADSLYFPANNVEETEALRTRLLHNIEINLMALESINRDKESSQLPTTPKSDKAFVQLERASITSETTVAMPV